MFPGYNYIILLSTINFLVNPMESDKALEVMQTFIEITHFKVFNILLLF